MKYCVIGLDDYRSVMPDWDFRMDGTELMAVHPVGVELRKNHGASTIGDKDEILKSHAEWFHDLASRHLKAKHK
jgi:hypothetical protein